MDNEKTSVDRNSDGLLVFADDWGRHPSSCQHLIQRLRDRHKILWVNTIGTRAPSADGFTFFRGSEKIKNWARGLKQTHPQMWVVDTPMLPMVDSPLARAVSRTIATNYIRLCLKRVGIRSPSVITTLPHTSWLLGNVNQTQIIYYCTDDYSAWRGADQAALLESENQLVSRATRVLAVSNHLMDRLSNRGIPCHHFSHAVDFDHFASSTNGATSHPEFSNIPCPRVGFFGLVYEKLDFELLTKVANAIAPVNLVMIGPVDYCPNEFEALPNVCFVGKQDYQQLPNWIAGLDVLLLPYLQDDEMIRQSSPLKLRECLATGKPTVSVNIPEVRKYIPHVKVAETHEDFVEQVKASLDHPEDTAIIESRQSAVRLETWDERALELEQFLTSSH